MTPDRTYQNPVSCGIRSGLGTVRTFSGIRAHPLSREVAPAVGADVTTVRLLTCRALAGYVKVGPGFVGNGGDRPVHEAGHGDREHHAAGDHGEHRPGDHGFGVTVTVMVFMVPP